MEQTDERARTEQEVGAEAPPRPAAPMRMFDFGSPWVIAASPTTAIKAATREHNRLFRPLETPYEDPREMDPAEVFTMHYEEPDDIPRGLTRDEFECNCGPAGPHDCGCDVTVTMTVREWCEHYSHGRVIWEFQG